MQYPRCGNSFAYLQGVSKDHRLYFCSACQQAFATLTAREKPLKLWFAVWAGWGYAWLCVLGRYFQRFNMHLVCITQPQ